MDKDVLNEEKSAEKLTIVEKTEGKKENFAVRVLTHCGLLFLALMLLCIGTAIKDAIDGFNFMQSLYYGLIFYLCYGGIIGSIVLVLYELIKYRDYCRLKKETAK